MAAHGGVLSPPRGRGVAQPGRAHGSGPCGRRFKSSRPDHLRSGGPATPRPRRARKAEVVSPERVPNLPLDTQGACHRVPSVADVRSVISLGPRLLSRGAGFSPQVHGLPTPRAHSHLARFSLPNRWGARQTEKLALRATPRSRIRRERATMAGRAGTVCSTGHAAGGCTEGIDARFNVDDLGGAATGNTVSTGHGVRRRSRGAFAGFGAAAHP